MDVAFGGNSSSDLELQLAVLMYQKKNSFKQIRPIKAGIQGHTYNLELHTNSYLDQEHGIVLRLGYGKKKNYIKTSYIISDYWNFDLNIALESWKTRKKNNNKKGGK